MLKSEFRSRLNQKTKPTSWKVSSIMSDNLKMNTEKRQKLIKLSLLIYVLASMVVGISSEQPKNFVLVHGACHGAWSWYKLVPLLKSAGHNVTALDLAGSGVDPQQASDLRSISDYNKPLMEFMASLPGEEKVVLVAHSFGGLAISQAMERFPEKIYVAVFLTALMPGPTLNASTVVSRAMSLLAPQMDNRFTFEDGPNSPPTTITFGPLYLSARLYQLSPPEDKALASTLMRPIRLFSAEDLSRVIAVSEKKYGSVNRVYIISEKDLLLTKDFAQWMIQKNPPHQVEEIKGSDHMVMMSQPIQLYNLLLRIVEKYKYNY